MQVAVLTGNGGSDMFKLEERETPALGPTQVLVKVAASGLCSRDQRLRRGDDPLPGPIVLGHEVSGTVEAVGSRVGGLQPGDRIATVQVSSCGRCMACVSGDDVGCTDPPHDGLNEGGYADHVVVEERSCALVPDTVDLIGASILACVCGIPWRALTNLADVQEGDTVVVTGAGGALGIHGLQLAKALGAQTIGITSSADETKVSRLKNEGLADHVVVSQGNYGQTILDLTGGQGVDVVLDNVGAPQFDGCFQALAHGGRYVLTEPGAPAHLDLYPFAISAKECTITGSDFLPTGMGELLQFLELAGRGQLTPVVQQYALADVLKANDDMDNRRLFGRAVLVP